jgi:hypothetical protein
MTLTPEDRRLRYEAHKAVKCAFYAGTLKRKPCKVCGKKKTHAHHEDYRKPLKITWLCRKHHFARHRQLNWERFEKMQEATMKVYRQAMKEQFGNTHQKAA